MAMRGPIRRQVFYHVTTTLYSGGRIAARAGLEGSRRIVRGLDRRPIQGTSSYQSQGTRDQARET